jgi:hypothetical protein
MLGWECYCECDSEARPERSKTERGRDGPGLALLAGVQTVFLLEREDFGMSMLLRLGKMLRPGNLNVLSLLWHIPRYLIMYLNSKLTFNHFTRSSG